MQSINITSTSSTAPRLQATATLFSYSLAFQPEAYGYSSPLDAYVRLNSTLSNDVYSGQFSYVIESMSSVPIYSSLYKAAYSNYIHFLPYPYFPTLLPTAPPGNKTISVSALGVGNSSPSNALLEYIYIAIAIFLGVSLASVLAWYLHRRNRTHTLKTNALSKIAGMQNTGEIIPEEGDNVEWGVSQHQFQFYDDMPTTHGGLNNYYEWDDEWSHGLGSTEPATFSKKADLLTL